MNAATDGQCGMIYPPMVAARADLCNNAVVAPGFASHNGRWMVMPFLIGAGSDECEDYYHF
ncbi:hypothetical protein [Ralstonia pseudosolanacearum]|nr:hypothetical protein [Ralstonia pseudosolanacearum]